MDISCGVMMLCCVCSSIYRTNFEFDETFYFYIWFMKNNTYKHTSTQRHIYRVRAKFCTKISHQKQCLALTIKFDETPIDRRFYCIKHLLFKAPKLSFMQNQVPKAQDKRRQLPFHEALRSWKFYFCFHGFPKLQSLLEELKTSRLSISFTATGHCTSLILLWWSVVYTTGFPNGVLFECRYFLRKITVVCFYNMYNRGRFL